VSRGEASRQERSGSLRLIGPAIKIAERDGSRRVVSPTDAGYSQLWARLPEAEREWQPSWGFHPDDDPDSYLPDAVF
jgi:hypothetical protein